MEENEGSLRSCKQFSIAFSSIKEIDNHNGSYLKLPKIANSVLELMGKTPLVRMHRLEKKLGLNVQLLGKCENFNPGGSVKDRIGISMI